LLALKPTGGTLHVHMNVEEEHIEAWVEASVERFQSLIEQHGLALSVEPVHLERVKWFAPRVRHVVLDLNLRP
jgi:tRNA G37 N-methylase Trm5